MKKNIIYDFDGVICDSVNVKTEAFAKIYSEYGHSIVSKVVDYHNLHGGISRYEKIKYFHKNFLNIDLNSVELDNLASRFSNLVLEKVINSKFIDGVFEFLNYNYSNNVKQFICTGTPQEEINFITKNKSIEYLFNGIYGSPKTKEQIILEILNNFNINKKDVVFFGDALTDYNAALFHNLKFIGIKSKEVKFPSNIDTIDSFKSLDYQKL